MFTLDFWKAIFERAVRTFAQALGAVLGANQLNVLSADWGQALGVAAGAALLSVLMGVGLQNVGPKGTPDVTTTVPAEEDMDFAIVGDPDGTVRNPELDGELE
jgi:hypothetical protein